MFLWKRWHVLEDRGLIDAEWGLSENNRRARFYAITATGRKRLRHGTAVWVRFAHAMAAALEAPGRAPAEG